MIGKKAARKQADVKKLWVSMQASPMRLELLPDHKK
jgi:hypothetical protein